MNKVIAPCSANRKPITARKRLITADEEALSLASRLGEVMVGDTTRSL